MQFVSQMTSSRGLPTDANNREDETYSSFAWQLKDGDVRPLPEIYPRLNNPLVLKDIPVEVIAKRLSRFMRINSVPCKYDTEEARAIGSTPYVSFVVQLWKPQQDARRRKNHHHILVEITRRLGCGIAMHKIRHALAQSLQSDEDPVRYETLLSLCHQFKPSPRLKASCSSGLAAKVPCTLTLNRSMRQKRGLDSALELLESISYDEQDLGMESIAFLTDQRKVAKVEAVALSSLLVFRKTSLAMTTDPSPFGPRLQNAVEDYVYDLLNVRPRGSSDTLFHFTLTALSNALELMLEDIIPETLSQWSCNQHPPMLRVYWRHMLNFFLRRLSAYREFPESAALAAKCIRLLATLTMAISGEGVIELHSYCEGLPLVLQDACRYGKSFHAVLEREASDLRHTVDKLQ